MAKPDKQIVIDYLISEIGKGSNRGKVLGKAGKKWGFSRTTFDRLWKIANDQQKERQQKAKEAADAAYIQASANAAKSAVMSSQERKEILTKIAKGELSTKEANPDKSGEFVNVPVPIGIFERLKAIAELNKMEGDYAPIKNNLTLNKVGLDAEEENYT